MAKPDCRTLQRREVIVVALKTFGSEQRARDWLRSEVPSLGNKRPQDLLKTIRGGREVLNTLNAIEYGVYL